MRQMMADFVLRALLSISVDAILEGYGAADDGQLSISCFITTVFLTDNVSKYDKRTKRPIHIRHILVCRVPNETTLNMLIKEEKSSCKKVPREMMRYVILLRYLLCVVCL